MRWTLFGVLLTANVIAGAVFNGTWIQIVASSLTGAGMVGLVVEYFWRGRHR